MTAFTRTKEPTTDAAPATGNAAGTPGSRLRKLSWYANRLRSMSAAEIEACSEYLERQTGSLNPKVIVTLGRFSMARFFPNARISAIHGKPQRIGNRVVVPMYHPAAALHRPSLRATIQADFARLPELIGREGRPIRAEDSPTVDQLSLF